ncbi:hypothetical protein [Acidianus brierleyi]|uniref:DUF5658 domain-containing protein n=1 Tax=Acidianus brierleyi TaxID=41673 RepID=A0A2U9IHI1_9CREN|nr:hypothetical protein [Acidianus brierleyi]AWR95507.1 hypothetical protein DFR85_13810 [Acidianus brierleyi]
MRIRTLWLILILGNLYDYVATLVFAYLHILCMDRNVFIGYSTSFSNVITVLTGEKLLFLNGVYWFSKLFDYLKISNYKWLGLLPFTIITALIVIDDSLAIIITLF